jgi:hypothetical protein
LVIAQRTLTVAALLLAFLPQVSSAAEPVVIRLRCVYTHSLEGGKPAGASGESLVTVRYSADGAAKIKKQDLGAEFVGLVSDDEITGETSYQLDSLRVKETLVINRFTGAFRFSYEILGGNTGSLIQFGTCRATTQPLF